MPRRVIISGLGPVSAIGIGIEPTWQAATAGQSAIAPIAAFDPAGFDSRIGGEVKDFKTNKFVPKTYRKATKVMARDIGLAVAGADLAARDAALVTRGTHGNGDMPELSYHPTRVGAHIGAGLIAAELDELTGALIEARDADGRFDMRKWGNEGMSHLTPLWLLKYLPNMLACHVTIIHDCQGPSNTITCAEASAGLSIGESLRVIQRGAADACFCGGAESNLNPMSFLRQLMTERYNTQDNDQPATAVRPFCLTASGCVVGEGGGIVILEALETFEQRAARTPGARVYAEIVGFGASQSVNMAARNLRPDQQGRAVASAIRTALREAQIEAQQIDLIVPFGLALAESDRAEAAALQSVFGDALDQVPLASVKPLAGNCGAGAGALDMGIVAKALAEQTVPAIINCDQPLAGLSAAGAAPSRQADLQYALTYSSGIGGQNAAIVLKKFHG